MHKLILAAVLLIALLAAYTTAAPAGRRESVQRALIESPPPSSSRSPAPAATAQPARPNIIDRAAARVKAFVKGERAPPPPPAAAASVPASSTGLPNVGRTVPACQPHSFCYTTTVQIDATAQAVIGALNDNWSKWWAGGLATEQQHLANGVFKFTLAPIKAGPIAPIKVQVTAQSPATNAKSGVTTIPVTLAGDFVGQAGWTIWPNPAGGVRLQSTWHNMQAKNIAADMGGMAIQAHWLAEDNALKNLNNYLNGRPTSSISLREVASRFGQWFKGIV